MKYKYHVIYVLNGKTQQGIFTGEDIKEVEQRLKDLGCTRWTIGLREKRYE